MVWKALKACISAVMAMARGLLVTALGAITLKQRSDMEGQMLTIRSFTLVPASCTALDISSAVASPFLGFLALMGNKIIFDLNSFNL